MGKLLLRIFESFLKQSIQPFFGQENLICTGKSGPVIPCQTRGRTGYGAECKKEAVRLMVLDGLSGIGQGRPLK
jgi:hypothetical protein